MSTVKVLYERFVNFYEATDFENMVINDILDWSENLENPNELEIETIIDLYWSDKLY